MSFHVAVVGIGAMGGGMARALLTCDDVSQLVGYDRSTELVQALFEESKALQKTPTQKQPPTCLEEAITEDTNVVLLVLVNEEQCEQVCFGLEDANLLQLLAAGSYVVLCSTVTATWARQAETRFRAASIHLVDCPISGGPVRARAGDLTLMVSSGVVSESNNSDQQHTKYIHEAIMPILQALARHVHVIAGRNNHTGVGMASTAKMVHQLLAGVHICVAAEALALAAKAGLDPHQMYEIVNGAAGASWMFQDRGARMLWQGDDGENNPVPVMSALEIFVKDLDIVYSEAKKLQSPIPVGAAALQQFISGQALGLSRSDDSQVVSVYENVTGVPVRSSSKREGTNVGEYWKMADGTLEEILEVGSEPRHRLVLSNDYVRVLRVAFPPNDTTLAHRHDKDSLYFFLVDGGLDVVNHIQGRNPQCDCMGFGEVRMGLHKSEGPPLVHKITNKSSVEMLCIDAEVLMKPPVTAAIPLLAPFHDCIKTRDRCRVYRLLLAPGESVTVTYAFFHLTVVVKPSIVQKSIHHGSGSGDTSVSWTTSTQLGDVAWHEPVTKLTQANVGEDMYEVYIAEWK